MLLAVVVSFPEPAEQLPVEIFPASDFHCMAVDRGPELLRSNDSVVPELAVQNKSKTQTVSLNACSTKVECRDKVDRGLDRVDPRGTELLQFCR